MHFPRTHEQPKRSTILLGPRGTGKSSFIKGTVKAQLVIDLLKTTTLRELSINPSKLEDLTGHLKAGDFVFIDEIQKLPELLDEVHRLIEDKKLHFILSGSSARKLKKAGTNLLAGRATTRKMFPLTLKEIGKHRTIPELLFSGQLPYAVTQDDTDTVNDYLFSYAETYLHEEIAQEGLTRRLTDFSNFIELAGRNQGQIINFENIARDTKKSGDTIKNWFQILSDTLIGTLIDPFTPGIFSRETKHQKFYFFDCGIARAAQGVRNIEDIPESKGFLFETIILNELRTYIEIKKKNYRIYYYAVPNTGDLDFIVETKRKSLSSPAEYYGIEVKLAQKWSPNFEKLSAAIHKNKPTCLKKIYAVYTGKTRLTRPSTTVLPVNDFVAALWDDELF